MPNHSHPHVLPKIIVVVPDDPNIEMLPPVTEVSLEAVEKREPLLDQSPPSPQRRIPGASVRRVLLGES